MESASSEIYNTKSRNNEDDGEADSKWKSEYELIFLQILFVTCLSIYFEAGSHYVAQAGLKITTPPNIKSYRHALSCLADE